MEPQRGIFSESLRIVNHRMAFVLAAVIGQFAIQLARETLISNIGLTFASAMIWSMLAFIAHSESLRELGDQDDMDISRVFGFAVRAVCLASMSAIPCVLLLSTMTISTDPDIAVGAFLVAVVPAFAVAGVLVFALFGTILPAYIAGECESLGDALRRGSQQFLWLAGRLAAPAGLAMLASALLVAPVVLFGIPGIFISGGYVPNPLVMPFALIAYVLLTWAIVLTAVILSRAFLRDSKTESQDRSDVSVAGPA